MAHKNFTVDQVESGKLGVTNLGYRLDGFDTSVEAISTDVAKANETIMAMASAPVTTPVFSEVQSYTVLEADVVAATPTPVDVPASKTYIVGKNNMMVLRNGAPQVIAAGDYTETDSGTVTFPADYLKVGDVITFVINSPTKLNYAEAVTYYGEGANLGKVNTITYTGDIARVITYTYNEDGKIATEAVAEDGKTTTKTFTYDVGTGKLTGVAAVVA